MLGLETIKRTIKQRYSTGKIACIACFGLSWGGISLGRVAGENSELLAPPVVQTDHPEEDRFQIVNFKSNKWDHNFAITVGGARGDWILDQFGPVEGETYKSRAFFGKFQYAFHLSLAGNLGYVIGSSFGYYWEKGEDKQQFRQASAIHFPGIHAGVVYSFTPFFRVEAAFETYLERLDRLQLMTQNGAASPDEYKVSVTMRPNYDWILISDFFYSESWGVRLEWHARKVDTNPPTDSNGQIIGVRLTKRDTWMGLGLIYHLFAT